MTGDLDPMHARGEDWRTGADVAITVTGSDGTDAGAGEAKLSTSARSFLAWLPPDGRLAAGEYIVRLA